MKNKKKINPEDKDSLQETEGGEEVKLVKAKLSDAAYDNQRDTERMLEASEAARPSYELNLEADRKPEKKPSKTKGSGENKKEELGGTTNLSLDQLKDEGDPAR